jgi:hypothetical protein
VRLLKFYEVNQSNKNVISFIDKTGHQRFKTVDVIMYSKDKIKIFFDSSKENMEAELTLSKVESETRISRMKIKRYSKNSVTLEDYQIDFFDDDYLIKRIEKNVNIVMLASGDKSNTFKRQVSEIIDISEPERNKGKALSFFIGQKNI